MGDYVHGIINISDTCQDDTVVGYALSLERTFDANRIPYLDGLNQVINAATDRGRSVAELNYIIMGQVCIARKFRGQGVFASLYHAMRRGLQDQFDCVVTAVCSRNPRSLRAHAKVGFVTVHQYHAHGHDWHIVLWDWKTCQPNASFDDTNEGGGGGDCYLE